MNKTLDRTTTQVSEEELAAHLESAQVPALIMLTAHVTGDTSVLRDEWRPNLRALPSSGLDAETEAAARAVCFELLAPHLATQNTWASVPSEELRLAMSTWLMGAPVEDALAMSEVSFIPNNTDPRQPEWKLADIAPDTALNAVVIGAGFSGLLAGLRLKQAGVPFKIIEKSQDVGGTWWENTYPDCRTDVRSHIYTYSFTQHDWETHFGRQDKIHDYLHQFAADNGLLEHMVYGTEVTATRWNEDTSTWTLETKTEQGVGETFESSIVVSAVGQLNRPSIPNLEGLDTFKGPDRALRAVGPQHRLHRQEGRRRRHRRQRPAVRPGSRQGRRTGHHLPAQRPVAAFHPGAPPGDRGRRALAAEQPEPVPRLLPLLDLPAARRRQPRRPPPSIRGLPADRGLGLRGQRGAAPGPDRLPARAGRRRRRAGQADHPELPAGRQAHHLRRRHLGQDPQARQRPPGFARA